MSENCRGDFFDSHCTQRVSDALTVNIVEACYRCRLVLWWYNCSRYNWV